jgi:DNA-binding CsgD family transcriptional regulator
MLYIIHADTVREGKDPFKPRRSADSSFPREEFKMVSLSFQKTPSGSLPSQCNSGKLLTTRELQVLSLVAAGVTTKEIAYELGIAYKTAACHRGRILSKLAAHNAADLTRHAMGMGLITAREIPVQGFVTGCVQRQELVQTVQCCLRRLAELANAEVKAIAGGTENVQAVLHRQIVNQWREEELAMAELHEHREKHRC